MMEEEDMSWEAGSFNSPKSRNLSAADMDWSPIHNVASMFSKAHIMDSNLPQIGSLQTPPIRAIKTERSDCKSPIIYYPEKSFHNQNSCSVSLPDQIPSNYYPQSSIKSEPGLNEWQKIGNVQSAISEFMNAVPSSEDIIYIESNSIKDNFAEASNMEMLTRNEGTVLRNRLPVNHGGGDDCAALNELCSTPIRSLCKPSKQHDAPSEKSSPPTHFRRSLRKCCCFIVILPISLFILAILVTSVHQNMQCHQTIRMDVQIIRDSLQENIFGQHIVIQTIPHLLRRVQELANVTGSKPWVLSFHGWTGVGKTYVSSILTNLLESDSVTRFVVPLHFPHDSMNAIYEKDVFDWVISNVTKCSLNVFVFDEMDKAGPGVISGLQKALTNLSHSQEKGQSLFLLLSNSKGQDINQYVFQQIEDGRAREDMLLKEMQSLFRDGSDMEWYSGLLKNELINAFIPFLPLEKRHIKQCIQRDLISKGHSIDLNLVEAVANELFYHKLPTSGLEFSVTGCKRVQDKVDFHIYS